MGIMWLKSQAYTSILYSNFELLVHGDPREKGMIITKALKVEQAKRIEQLKRVKVRKVQIEKQGNEAGMLQGRNK